MEIQVLKQEIKDRVKTDPHLQAELAASNTISIFTVGQWRLKDNPMLTTINNLAIIRKHLKLPEDAKITEEKVPEPQQ